MPGVIHFSKTANLNASACPTVGWAEGMPPSQINDSSRAEMAAVACYRDDISGSILTTGTSAAYQVASNQGFDTLANFHNQIIGFTPHVTNAIGPVTMTVDGFANLPLRSAPGVELPAGVLVQGTPYVALYNNTDHALYLRSFYGASPYLIPVGAMLDFTGSTAPNSSFVFPFGQAISRTTYASYFAMVGITYGSGDGSTTFNIPDLRGRIGVAADNMGGIQAGRINGVLANGLGSVGGAQNQALVTANLPPYTPAGTVTNGAISISHNAISGSTTTGGGGFPAGSNGGASISASQAASTFTGSPQGGTSTPVTIVQPSIVVNKILRII
ncbi:phage tail protein [Bradyrhizobium sp. CCBAU 51627]|uniref:phage tail protein n=1 Tax=Bradyrhizobium sp. CCBAU 51627 TaxID=1325088 RepID=UPI002305E8EE|nr:phage tail protein [Bradyrhizobium sp. CCBAU 51627]MDA9437252.1 tail protein [Bradyrhizobium sp. CCBAU 51627]